ncbi:hypothetical protein PQQ51_19480 [Paraburkholderia xenovorans]|uniref:hypothetical protein n=1 Tax=Paraburkholderia xenovorans TaxID=36873 RepID=UPI0038B9BDF7
MNRIAAKAIEAVYFKEQILPIDRCGVRFERRRATHSRGDPAGIDGLLARLTGF